MSDISYVAKARSGVENVVIVYPYTYVHPFHALPPIAAEYLQAGVVEAGRRVTLLDMRFEGDIRHHLESADLVCLYGFFEDCSIFGKWKIHVIPEVLAQIPEGVPVVAGGTGFAQPEEALRSYPRLDVVVRGVPDGPIRELLETGSPQDVDNLVYRKGDEFVRNRSVDRLSDDVYPRRHLRNPAYEYHVVGIPVDLVRAAIGCNYRCRFCYAYGKDTEGNFLRWQSRSAESQFKELSEIEAPIVIWVDDDMTTDMKSLETLADLLIRSGTQKLLIGTGRIDHVIQSDVSILHKLERAGLLRLSFGVESLNDETLRFYRKGQTVSEIDEAMRMVNETNILLACNFLLGSPGDSADDMLKFLDFGRRWNVDTIVTNRLKIQDGSDLDRAIRDPETGEILPGKRRIRGKELKRLKQMIKFGQRAPLRVTLSALKAFRHRGLFIDPFYILCSALETAMRNTWLERTGIGPAALYVPKRITSLPAFRAFTRWAAAVATPPVRWANRLFEAADARLEVSTAVMPAAFDLYRRTFLEKQKRRVQPVRGGPAGGAP